MKKLNLNILGMRGICILMILESHLTGAFNLPWIQTSHNPLRIFLDGHTAVFFFMQSGYFYYTLDSLYTLKKNNYVTKQTI